MESPCGVVAINKQKGVTSHYIVNKLRLLYGTRQIGHTGTLDPMAEGVMAVLVGRAVKFAEYVIAEDKEYTAELRLGVRSDTGDNTGTVVETGAAIPDETAVEAALAGFRGEIVQIPPMYSALKVNGKKLVDLARRGITVEREGRPVTVSRLVCEKLGERDYRLDAAVSKGTYIRVLCTDLGERLGCGAVMTALTRTRSGCFSLSDAVTLEELGAMSMEERCARLRPVAGLFETLPRVPLPPFYARLAHSGCEIYCRKIRPVLPEGLDMGDLAALYDADGFFALARLADYPDGPALKPVKQLYDENLR